MRSQKKVSVQTLERSNKFTHGLSQKTTKVNSFLGLASYYHWFVPDFPTVAQPLYKLKEAKKELVCTEECQLAFDSPKGSLTSARDLAYPTRGGKFVLDTDISGHGIASQILSESLKELVCDSL